MTHLAFQLYSAREAGPVEAVLPRLAALGYDGVEPVLGAIPDPKAFARRLEDHGLTARSGHVMIEDAEADPEARIAAARSLGLKTVVIPWLAPDARPASPGDWRSLGDRLARLADRMAAGGLALAWHNHDFEMEPLPDGTCGLEHLIQPDRGVLWEADLAWIVRAGEDPAAWLRRFAGSVPLIHVKDLAPPGTEAEGGWADPGHGTMDWTALWTESLRAGATSMIAEHDDPDDLDRFAARAAAAMRRFARTTADRDAAAPPAPEPRPEARR